MWLYHQWMGDHRDDAELAKNHAYLLGSFYNPEAVQDMMNDNKHESSDEDFEESLKMVQQFDAKQLSTQEPIKVKKRKRKAILKE